MVVRLLCGQILSSLPKVLAGNFQSCVLRLRDPSLLGMNLFRRFRDLPFGLRNKIGLTLADVKRLSELRIIAGPDSAMIGGREPSIERNRKLAKLVLHCWKRIEQGLLRLWG